MNLKRYTKKIDIKPTYKQIVTYIDNRRRRIFDKNNLEGLKSYIEKHLTYRAGVTEDNELFTFGVEYGTGTDDSHFTGSQV